MSARVMPIVSVRGSYSGPGAQTAAGTRLTPQNSVGRVPPQQRAEPAMAVSSTAEASCELHHETRRIEGNSRCNVTNQIRMDNSRCSSSASNGSSNGSSKGSASKLSSSVAVIQHALKSSASVARTLCAYCDREVFATKLEEHQKTCRHESTWCENKCGLLVERQLMNSHVADECSKRLVACSACSKKFVFDTLQTHHINCPRMPVPCPNRCDVTLVMPREDMDGHLEYYCPLVRTPCSFKDVGCSYKGCRRELETHLLEATVKHLSLACDVISQQRQELKALRSMTLSAASSNGELFWRVPEFRRVLAECKAAPAVSCSTSDVAAAAGELVSPPFYTSPGGYKLVASVFPNGNGSGEGEYLSVYIKVLPGEFDHVLEWPFPLGVTFTVYDQCPRIGRVNISESFAPDPTWKHFQKPPRDRGQTLGFGYPRFVSHAELRTRNYLRDDALLIRVRADGAERLPMP